MRVFLKRRALSTVVTAALMLTAVAMIGTGIVVWSNSNLRSFENKLITSASDKTNKINEIPTIENIILDPNPAGSKLVNVTITNSGTITFTVSTIQISDSTQSVVKTVNVSIPKQSSQLFSYAYTWQSGKITTIQMTTSRGTLISTQVMHP